MRDRSRERIKRLALLVSAGTCMAWTAGPLFAQFKAGFDLSTISSPGASGRFGFAGGVGLCCRPGADRGGWQTDVLFRQTRIDDLLQQGDSIGLTYIEGAALLHGDVVKLGGRDAVYFLAGPSLSFNLRAAYTDRAGARDNVRDRLKLIDTGISAGGGLERGHLILEARYTWGLRRVFENFGPVDGKNRDLIVMIGFRR